MADKFKLFLTATGMGSRIEKNGEEVQNVRAITVRAAADEITRVTVEHAICEVEIEAETDRDPSLLERAQAVVEIYHCPCTKFTKYCAMCELRAAIDRELQR